MKVLPAMWPDYVERLKIPSLIATWTRHRLNLQHLLTWCDPHGLQILLRSCHIENLLGWLRVYCELWQLQGVIISSLVKPPSSTHGHFCHNFSRSNLGHFVEKIVFIATVHYLGADIWTWLWAAGAWISSHRTECLRRLCAGRNLRTKGKKLIKNI